MKISSTNALSCRTRRILLTTLLALGSASMQAGLTIAEKGKANCAILRQADATEAERYAANELAQTLKQITGADFELQDAKEKVPSRAIIVGQGAAAKKYFPDVDFEKLGGEELVIRTKGKRLLLAGGRPRGTLYAVNRFLDEQCGVRWWAPWAAQIPQQPILRIPDLNKREKPAFEYREPFWFPAFDGTWAVRNNYNGNSARLTPAMGGKITYKGFVHTFYPLVPPEKYFKDHPEWYSLIDGKRTTNKAQLCLTNPELRDFMAARVKEWLRESPDATIISVSQNDWHGACQCANCKAIDDAEGGHAGTMLTFVNYVAEKVGREFPNVAIDTLAYQYTRHAPKTIKPLPNVIVRLCSIECNFGVPLEDPANAAFAHDMRDWAKICNRLYVWDYTTDFAHYVQPHPNWFSLGPNVRFFHQHNTKGLFEQGAYQSHGSEMAELRAWVLARLLWNPNQDDKALIKEFLEGYYGEAAAKIIHQYFEVMYQASRGYNLTCFSKTGTPFFKFEPLSRAEKLWQQAEAAVKDDPEKLWRVRQGHLPVRYVWLERWTALQSECMETGATWPLPASRKAVADEWLSVATGPGPEGWSKMTTLRESGLTPEAFVARFAEDPPPLEQKPESKN